MERMLTVQEAAEFLKVAPVTVRVWVWQGRFAGAVKERTRTGERWVIPQSSVETFRVGKPGRPKMKKTSRDEAAETQANDLGASEPIGTENA
jgi:hypothetical protein